MRTKPWAVVAAVGVFLGLAASGTRAQAPADKVSRESIEAAFLRDLVKIETAKIVGLGELAATQPAAEASKTYDALLRFAVNANLYEVAEPYAAKASTLAGAPVETALLAQVVDVVAKVQRGAFDESLATLAKVLNENRDQKKAVGGQGLPLAARLSLLNTYVQRLIYAGREDLAKKALVLIRDTTAEPQIKELAASRLAQVELVGKPAPEISGVDIDGKPVKLSDLRGQVVLVIFWASWHSPTAIEAQEFNQLLKTHADKGFRIIGINVDAKGEGATPKSVLPDVRRVLVENNITWPTLINGPGEADHAAAYAVTQIPADFLIGRDGKVVRLDLDPTNLEKLLPGLLAR